MTRRLGLALGLLGVIFVAAMPARADIVLLAPPYESEEHGTGVCYYPGNCEPETLPNVWMADAAADPVTGDMSISTTVLGVRGVQIQPCLDILRCGGLGGVVQHLTPRVASQPAYAFAQLNATFDVEGATSSIDLRASLNGIIHAIGNGYVSVELSYDHAGGSGSTSLFVWNDRLPEVDDNSNLFVALQVRQASGYIQPGPVHVHVRLFGEARDAAVSMSARYRLSLQADVTA